MTLTLLKAKIHRAVVTQADLNYVGSITIDATLMKKAGIVEYEKVLVADVDNGNRLRLMSLWERPIQESSASMVQLLTA